jgi:hypothetical protein
LPSLGISYFKAVKVKLEFLKVELLTTGTVMQPVLKSTPFVINSHTGKQRPGALSS